MSDHNLKSDLKLLGFLQEERNVLCSKGHWKSVTTRLLQRAFTLLHPYEHPFIVVV